MRFASRLPLAMLALIVCVFHTPLRAADEATSSSLDRALAAMPAQSYAEQDQLSRAILNGGAAEVAALCRRLIPPGTGDDTAVRYALAGLARLASGPKGQADRKIFNAGLAEALGSGTDHEINAFLLGILQFCADEQSRPVVSRFLDDPRLGEPARAVLAQLDRLKAAPVAELAPAGADAPVHRRLAALARQVEAQGARANRQLLEAMDDPDLRYSLGALGLAERLPGRRITTAWAAKIDDVGTTRQLEIAAMLGRRHDRAALPALKKTLASPDAGVRAAALEALGRLAGPEATEALIAHLAKGPEADLDAVQAALLDAADAQGLDRLAAQYPQAGAPAQAAILNVLAQRRATRHAALCLTATAPDAAALGQAKLKALRTMARPQDVPAMLDLLAAAGREADQALIAQAIAVAVQDAGDSAQAMQPVLARLNTADAAMTPRFVRALGKIGGPQALEAIQSRLGSTDPATRDAAVRVLADWPDAAPLDTLLTLAEQTTETTHRVLALRGCARLLPTVTDQPAGWLLERYRRALAIVPDAQETKAFLAGLGSVADPQALQILMPYVDREDLRAEAGQALVQAAGPLAAAHPEAVRAAMRRVLRAAPADAVRQGAEAVLAGLPPAPPALVPAPPEGFVALFNGRDLTGWKGLLAPPLDNPILRASASAEELAKAREAAEATMRAHWYVEDGILYFDGKGFSVVTAREDYGDFEMLVDWRIEPGGDSGIYLRGAPQIQIWDPNKTGIGSGGLYNNQNNPSGPLKTADRPVGEWNTFRIKMVGERVTVHLNGELIVDNVTMENYWDRAQPIFPVGQIELQCHGNPLQFRNIYLREIPRPGQWRALFNGRDLDGWTGDLAGNVARDGMIVSTSGMLMTEEQFGDFKLRFDFKLPPNGNNGIAIRSPLGGNPAYEGMEIQVIDDSGSDYQTLAPWQYHGSIYGVVAARRGALRPVGEWNHEEITATGNRISVVLNDQTIVDADLAEAIEKGTLDGHPHPGLARKAGHIGLLGHTFPVEFKNIEVMSVLP